MAGFAVALVHQCDQCTARNQLAQHLRQNVISHQLGDTHVKVAQQFGAPVRVVLINGAFFLRDVGAQGANLRRRRLQRKSSGHLAFEHATHRKHLARFVSRRRRHEGAARRLQRNQLVLRQLQQGLAYQRARDAEKIGQFLLGQLAAGQQAVFDNGPGQGLHNQRG